MPWGIGSTTWSGNHSRTAAGLSASDSPQFAALNIGHATNTTLAAMQAGRAGIEGRGLVMALAAPIVTDVSRGNATGEAVLSSLSLAANELTANYTVRFEAIGYWSQANLGPDLDIRFRFGGVAGTLLARLTIASVGTIVDNPFRVEGMITCRSTGANGSVYPQFNVWWQSTATSQFRAMETGGTGDGQKSAITVDTTVASSFDFTAQWSFADANSSITFTNLVWTYLQ